MKLTWIYVEKKRLVVALPNNATVATTSSSSSSSSRNEYYLGGIIALLLQDHRTISTKSVCSSQYSKATEEHPATNKCVEKKSEERNVDSSSC